MFKRRALILILLLLSSPALADNFVGQAGVIDGDTLQVHGMRIRLWGVDAPESAQLCRGEDSLQYRCGSQAANDLDAYIGRRSVNCVPFSLDPYGRAVATCSVAGTDLGEWLARNGLALDWPQYSKGRYGAIQRDVERNGWDSRREAMSSHGSIAPASAQAETRPPVRTMQMPILDEHHCEASIHNA
jgi:endonuclease YncB( thermonuclease family)